MSVTIALRDLRALLGSPFGWVLAAVGYFVLAWRFLQLVDVYQLELEGLVVQLDAAYGVTELVAAPFFGDAWLLLVLLLTVAVLSMRLVVDERQQGTLSLLFAAPVRSSAIVLGKFFGAGAFLTLLLLLWALMPFSLQIGTALDLGRLLAAWLGLWLMGLGLLACAVLASSLTAQPGLAAALTFTFGLLLMLLQQGSEASGALARLSLLAHYRPFLAGVVSTADLAYFALLAVGALVLAVRRLDSLRVQA